MLLVIDAGNTNTVFALYDGEALCGQWRMATDGRRTADEYAAVLLPLLRHAGFDIGGVTSAVLSSVVPAAVFPLRRFCSAYCAVEPLVVGDDSVKTGIPVRIPQPQEVGADMLVNAVAAWHRHGKAMIIVDFGTATTFQVTNGQGEFIGGCIAPGINLSIEALHRAAAALPSVEAADPGKVIGTDTVGAIQSGIFYGYLGLIEGIIQRIKAEYGAGMLVIATGGLAPLFEKATDSIDVVEQDLTIHGLRLIHHMNR